jgi:hypothetical protein
MMRHGQIHPNRLMIEANYEQPIYPKNLYAKAVPGRHADYKREVLDRQVG